MQEHRETHFDERSGIVECRVEWGRWWQSVAEVHIEVNVPAGTRSKAVCVEVRPSTIKMAVAEQIIIQGDFYDKVASDETIWTLEDGPKLPDLPRGKIAHVVLTKLGGGRLAPKKDETGGGEGVWGALLKGGGECWTADPLTLLEMRKKLDLERFQMENPGFDFSGAKLDKCYDKLPSGQ